MVLHKALDQYLLSYQTLPKYAIGFGNTEVLNLYRKTMIFADAEANADADANADAGDSTITVQTS